MTKKNVSRAGKMSQQIKELAIKPDNLSLVPRDPHDGSSNLYMHSMACMYPHTCTHQISRCNFKNLEMSPNVAKCFLLGVGRRSPTES